jgi:hypothetical protein
MTDPGPPPAPAAASRRRRRRPLGFLAVCLLVLLLVAGWLYVFAPVSAPPGVTLADLHGSVTCRPGSTPTAASPAWS